MIFSPKTSQICDLKSIQIAKDNKKKINNHENEDISIFPSCVKFKNILKSRMKGTHIHNAYLYGIINCSFKGKFIFMLCVWNLT